MVGSLRAPPVACASPSAGSLQVPVVCASPPASCDAAAARAAQAAQSPLVLDEWLDSKLRERLELLVRSGVANGAGGGLTASAGLKADLAQAREEKEELTTAVRRLQERQELTCRELSDLQRQTEQHESALEEARRSEREYREKYERLQHATLQMAEGLAQSASEAKPGVERSSGTRAVVHSGADDGCGPQRWAFPTRLADEWAGHDASVSTLDATPAPHTHGANTSRSSLTLETPVPERRRFGSSMLSPSGSSGVKQTPPAFTSVIKVMDCAPGTAQYVVLAPASPGKADGMPRLPLFRP